MNKGQGQSGRSLEQRGKNFEMKSHCEDVPICAVNPPVVSFRRAFANRGQLGQTHSLTRRENTTGKPIHSVNFRWARAAAAACESDCNFDIRPVRETGGETVPGTARAAPAAAAAIEFTRLSPSHQEGIATKSWSTPLRQHQEEQRR